MSGASSLGMSEPPRMVRGKAHPTEVNATKGLVLFPSPEVSPWPPFEGWAETISRQGAPTDPHPHQREEVVNYVLSGTVLHVDGTQRTTEIPEGSVHVLSAVAERAHDVRPRPGTEARWVSLVLHLPTATPEPREPYRAGMAVSRPDLRNDVLWRHVVGEQAPVHSLRGLEMWDLTLPGPIELEAPLGEGRRTVAYVIEGGIEAGGMLLRPGEALMLSGHPALPLCTDGEGRMILASVPRAG